MKDHLVFLRPYLKLIFVSTLGFSLPLQIVMGQGEKQVKREQDSPAQITIGFIPDQNREVLKTKTLEFAKVFQDLLHVPVNIFISSNYLGLVEAMRDKKIDFAFYPALTFVSAEKEANAMVLLKRTFGSADYHSILVVKKASKIKSLDGLKGKRIAFVDEKSTSGYLYPQFMFQLKKIEPKTFFSKIVFSGNHAKSSELLEKGEVDAITVFSDDPLGKRSAITKFLGEEKLGDYTILWSSEPIPNDSFCVRKDFYEDFPKLTHDLMSTLIDLSERAPHQTALWDYLGLKHLMLATTRQYDPVREMAKALDLK